MVKLLGLQVLHRRWRLHSCNTAYLVAAESYRRISFYPGSLRKPNEDVVSAHLANQPRHIPELEHQPSERTDAGSNKNAHDNIASPLDGLIVTHFLGPFKSPRPSINNSLMAGRGDLKGPKK